MTIATGTADLGPPPRKRGRPVTTGTTPNRNVRVGQIWNDCAASIADSPETMSDFVRVALTRELNRRRHLAALGERTATPATITGTLHTVASFDNEPQPPGGRYGIHDTYGPPAPAHPADCVCGHDGCQGETARARCVTPGHVHVNADTISADNGCTALEDVEADQ